MSSTLQLRCAAVGNKGVFLRNTEVGVSGTEDSWWRKQFNFGGFSENSVSKPQKVFTPSVKGITFGHSNYMQMRHFVFSGYHSLKNWKLSNIIFFSLLDSFPFKNNT